MTSLDMVCNAFKYGMIQRPYEILKLVEFLRFDEPYNHVLEIGSESGGTFYLWCQLAAGKKISVDLPSGASGSGKYKNTEIKHERDQLMRSWAPNVRLVTGDSHDISTLEQVKTILCVEEEKVDILFLDGDHFFNGVKQDFEMYSPLVANNGYIVFHDIKDTEYHNSSGCQVSQFWKELPGEKIEFIDWDTKEENDYDWGGIGVLLL